MTEIYCNPRVRARAPQPVRRSPPRQTGLFQAIGEFVNQLPLPQLQPVAAPNAPVSYQAKVLLALLSFFYAQGLYPSEEIELALSRDQSLRALCGQEYPSANLLRRFRRYNRDLLRECLAYTLGRVRLAPPDSARRSDGSLRPVAGYLQDLKFSYLQEAESRIEEAILRDTVDLD